MTDKLELKSSHQVIDTVNVADVESIFQGKPADPDILTVVMKDGKRLYCDEVCPVDSLQEEPVSIWHDASDPHDESKLLIVKLISGQVALYRGSFNNAQRDFGIYEVTEHGSEPKGIIEKWCYLEDILPDNK